jgi:hypothetical protein
MSARIPDTAKLVANAGGPVTKGRHAGHSITVALYEGEASQGYKSGYERVPTKWLEVVVREPRGVSSRIVSRYCTQYSGHRLAQAERDYRTNVANLQSYVENPS